MTAAGDAIPTTRVVSSSTKSRQLSHLPMLSKLPGPFRRQSATRALAIGKIHLVGRRYGRRRH